MAKTIQTPTDVVRCEWSGNRANAWDTDGNKRTSEITVGARQKAADGGYLLGKFQMKNGNTIGKDGMVKYRLLSIILLRWKFLLTTRKFLTLYTPLIR